MDCRRFIVAGSFIDGSGAGVQRNVFLTLQHGRISAIGQEKDLPRDKETPVDDLSRCTIVPPLVDCSVSLARFPAVDSRLHSAAENAAPEEKTAMVVRHIRYCLAHGVLGVADCDDITGLLPHDPKGTDRRNSLAIRIPARYGMSRRDRAGGDPANGDFLRVFYPANIEDEETSRPQMNPVDLNRILENRAGRKAVVVANGEQRVKEALAAGCDAIEQGYGMGVSNLGEMAEKNVLWMPSLLRARSALESAAGGGDVGCRFSQRYAVPGKPDPDAREFWEKMLSGQLELLRLARKLGVKTVLGTGAGSVGILHGESMVEEMKLFIKAGYSLAEAIRCGSENGARFFGMASLGKLAVGREATFLVTRGSAAQLPRKLSYLKGTYIAGVPDTL